MVNGFLAGAAGGASVSILINAIDNFSGIFTKAQKKTIALGAAITGLGAAGLFVSKGFIDVASSFETAFTGVRKTVELTEAEFAKLRGEFKELSKTIPVSFQELSSIGEIAGQLGVEGVDNLKKFTETIAAISVSTNLTAETAATSFARIANVMQLPLNEVDKMGSAVVDLGNNFATTEGEIVNFAERIAGAGNIAGLTTQDILAIGTAMSSVGIEAEAGGTAVQKVLLQMNTAVIEGNDSLKIFAKTSGLSSKEFVDAWEKDAGRAFSQFVIGLGDQGDNAVNTLTELELKDVRLVRAFLSLANAGDLVTESFKTSNKAWEQNSALVSEAEKRYATTESQVVILRNKFDALKDQMGQVLIPTFIKLIDVLGKVIGFMERHPTLTKFAVAAVAIGSALAIIVGPILVLTAMLPALVTGFGLLSAATFPITGTVLAISAAIVGVVAGIVLLIKWLKKLKGEKLEEAQEEFARLNPDLVKKPKTKKPKTPEIIRLNDFIMTPNGKIIKPSPQDTLIGTKTPNKLNGQNIIINIDSVQGLDSEMVSEALASEIKKVIRL